jgi:hypothetical protein
MFSYEAAGSHSERWHSAEIRMSGSSLQCAVTLFAKPTWTTAFTVTEKGQPSNLEKFELALRNDFPYGASKSAAILINGAKCRPDELC